LQPSIVFNIYNQCQAINLTSPVYFVHGGKWHATHDHKTNANVIMRNHLELDSRVDILEGVLIYRIQRKDNIFANLFHNESKYIQLLIAWRVEHTEGLHVLSFLVKHKGKLDEHKLRKLHQKYWHVLKVLDKLVLNGLMLDNATVLKTRVKGMNEGYWWDIFISEVGDGNVEPLGIDVDK
jgi:hypothetical protein